MGNNPQKSETMTGLKIIKTMPDPFLDIINIVTDDDYLLL